MAKQTKHVSATMRRDRGAEGTGDSKYGRKRASGNMMYGFVPHDKRRVKS